jgi:Kef-type K+ transport system membrane component KefB/Trk K+ transport system NAD-binding subunit
MSDQHLFALMAIAVVAAVAFLAPLLSLRIRQVRIPTIVIEILLGILLGKSGLGLIRADPVIEFLGAFGLIFLMFLAGFEIDFTLLQRGQGKGRYLLPWAIFLGGVLLAWLSSMLLQQAGLLRNVLLLTLILSTVSVGIVLPTLKERQELRTRFGQILIVTAVIADLGTMLMLTVYVVVYSKGWSLELLLIVAIFVVFLLAYAAGHFLRRSALLGRILNDLAHASTQIKVRGSMALLVGFVVLARVIGVEGILAAFLAGLLISLFSGTSRELLGTKLDALGFGFFIPIFFILVGARLDLPALVSSTKAMLLVPLLIGGSLLVRALPSLLLATKFRMRDALAGGMLLSARMSLMIAAAGIALNLGAISSTVHTALVMTAICLSLLAPLLYSWLRIAPQWRKPQIVIVGAGRVGREIVERLLVHQLDVVLIEREPQQLEKLKRLPGRVILGEGTDRETLPQIDLRPQDIFVSLTGNDEQNLQSCLLARREFGVSHTIARDNNPANTLRFQKAGVTPLNFSHSVAIALENLILRPSIMQLLTDTAGEVFAFEVRVSRPESIGMKVRELKGKGEALVLLIRRGDEIVVPHGETELQEEDRLVCLGTMEEEERLRRVLCARGPGEPF